MADKTAIEWTDATWNPLVGCSRVSDGCQHCYAERHAYRFSGGPGAYEGTARLVNGHPTFTGRVNLNERVLDLPLRWKRPRRIFVNSMSDLFHENVPDDTRDRIFAVMALAPRHTFQVLTKRPERMRDYCASDATLGRVAREVARCIDGIPGASARFEYKADGLPGLCLSNVWLGVSVENQAAANERIPLLLQTPAAVRFLSCEPLLGPLDLAQVHGVPHCAPFNALNNIERGYVRCVTHAPGYCFSDCAYRWPALDWVIAGGESGPGARPMHPDWVRSLRDQCTAAGVPFFFKQWGEWVSVSEVEGPGAHHQFSDGATVRRVGKKRAGHLLDGVEHHAFPEPRT